MSSYTYHRIFTDSEGESHYDEVTVDLKEMDFAPPAPPLFIGGRMQSVGTSFLKARAGWDGSWHPAPARQFMSVLSGVFDVTVSDGEERSFKAGDLILLDDISGKGHYTRVPDSAGDSLILVVQLGDD